MILFNGLLLTMAAAGAGLTWLREALGLLGIFGVFATVAFEAGVATLVMWLLPRRAERWQELVPGALLVSVGAQLVSVAVVFYFAPRIGPTRSCTERWGQRPCCSCGSTSSPG